jgi:hypothetical protein
MRHGVMESVLLKKRNRKAYIILWLNKIHQQAKGTRNVLYIFIGY